MVIHSYCEKTIVSFKQRLIILVWVAIATKFETSKIPLFTSNSLQNFKQIKQETPEILPFNVFNVLQDSTRFQYKSQTVFNSL